MEEVIHFTKSSSTYTCRYDVKATLTHDAVNDIFTLVMPDGEVFKFYDFDQATNPQGAFKNHKTVGGQETTVASRKSKVPSGRLGYDDRIVLLRIRQQQSVHHITHRRKVNTGS